MKNIGVIIRISALLLISDAAILCDVSSGAEGPGVEIVSIRGDVEVLLADEEDYMEAEEDMFLQAGDSIKTADASYAELAFDEEAENIVRIEEDTYAVFILGDDEKIELLEGEIFSTINSLPAGASFEIRTPTAVAAMRGTDWLTRVDEYGTDIEAVTGDLYVKGIDRDGAFMPEETVVSAGYRTRVRKFQRPAAPSGINPAKLTNLRSLKGDIKGRARKVIEKRKEGPAGRPRMDRMKDVRKKMREKVMQHKIMRDGGVHDKETEKDQVHDGYRTGESTLEKHMRHMEMHEKHVKDGHMPEGHIPEKDMRDKGVYEEKTIDKPFKEEKIFEQKIPDKRIIDDTVLEGGPQERKSDEYQIRDYKTGSEGAGPQMQQTAPMRPSEKNMD